MATRVKVGSKNQIAVPAAIRRELQIKPGDHLLLEVRDGHVIAIPDPSETGRSLRGLYPEIWAGVDPDAYVRGEREGCQE